MQSVCACLQATSALTSLIAGSLAQLGVPMQVARLVGGVLAVMQSHQTGLQKLKLRLNKQLKQVRAAHLTETWRHM